MAQPLPHKQALSRTSLLLKEILHCHQISSLVSYQSPIYCLPYLFATLQLVPLPTNGQVQRHLQQYHITKYWPISIPTPTHTPLNYQLIQPGITVILGIITSHGCSELGLPCFLLNCTITPDLRFLDDLA